MILQNCAACNMIEKMNLGQLTHSFMLCFSENVPAFTEEGNTAHAGTACPQSPLCPSRYCMHAVPMEYR